VASENEDEFAMKIETGVGSRGLRAGRSSTRRLALAMGTCAALAVVLTLDGPGLTIDEPLDVRPGRTYLDVLQKRGRHFFDRAVVYQVFRDNAEHPPLGRWLLGIASVLGEPFEVLWKDADPTGQYVLAGRLAPASCFAILVALVALVAGRRWGNPAGAAAAFALASMPRVFAHAHLAALETFVSLFWTAALLVGDWAVRSRQPLRVMAGAGAVWGLVLLTKLHGWLLLPILGLWTLRWLPPRRAAAAMAVWAVTGIGLFWLGWPWLWYDTWARLQQYFGTSVTRPTIMVEYFGRVLPDRDVPWHYPWFYFAVTVPLGLQALGAVGIAAGWKHRRADPLPLLLAGTILAFLFLFSTRVPLYDGERLFLHVFPAWALLIGLGFGSLWNQWLARPRRRFFLVGVLLVQSYGVFALHPFGLSYYNALVGGLPGAQRLGLELTYWNDAVDSVLLDRLAHDAARGTVAALVPTLYPGQGVLTTNRALVKREIILKDEDAGMYAEWLVLSRRTAYWRPEIRERLVRGGGVEVATRSRQGIWLSALWQFPPRPHERSTGPVPARPAQAPTPGPARGTAGNPLRGKDL
jgi:4-amino-4-deoxy-L-arabinose transferase-like glycosyltransferase